MSTGSTSPSTRRLLATTALAAAAVLGASACGTDDDTRAAATPSASASASDDPAFLTEPDTTWTVTAEEIAEDDGDYFFNTPVGYAHGESSAPLVVGSTALVEIRNRDDDAAGSTLAGISTTDGSVRWRTKDAGFHDCTTLPDNALAACVRYGEEDKVLRLYDVRTGDVQATWVPGDQDFLQLATDEDSVYVAAVGYDDLGLTLTRLDAGTLEEQSSRTYPAAGKGEGSDASAFEVGEDRIAVNVGTHSWLVDAESSELLASTSRGAISYLVSGHALTSSGIEDLGGSTVLELSANPWWGSGVGTNLVLADGTVGSGRALYRVGTGDIVWDRTDLDAQSDLTWTPDRKQVIAADADFQGFALLDGADGSTVWRLDEMPLGAFSPDAYVYGKDGKLTVLDREDGTPAWSRAYPQDRDEEGSATITIGQDAIITSLPDHLGGFSGFEASAGR